MDKEKSIPMRVVKDKTDLTSRQIRYYDQVNLIFPARSTGNQRLFSEADIEKLRKIKKLINQGYNINSIKKKLSPPEPVKPKGEESGHVDEKTADPVEKKYKKNMLSSLYPVSNRSYLTRVLQQNEDTK